MRRFILPFFIAILLLNGPVVHAVTTAELQAQIAVLLQQVQALQAQLQAAQGSTVSAQGEPNLTFNLRRGSTDAATGGEVSKLQQFLAKDKTIYPEGLITGYFGALTEQAVKRWQTRNGIEAVGIVGPKTRVAIKQAVTVAVAPPPPVPAPGATSTVPTSTPATVNNLGKIILSPSSGRVGEAVTITGTGFTSTGNNIHFGIGGVKNINSFNNGNMITFQVPSAISACDLIDSSITACLAPDVLVTPGDYTVYITNANGETASTTFMVTADTTYPSIVSASPDFGRVGTSVTLTGTGFTLQENEVHFGVGGIRGVTTLRKVNGTLLNFNVPDSVNSCDFSTGLPPCSSKTYTIVPGAYSLYIVNANGKTNSVTFTVTSY